MSATNLVPVFHPTGRLISMKCAVCEWIEQIPATFAGLGLPPSLLLKFSRHRCGGKQAADKAETKPAPSATSL
jgi:hypothetical protein